jgi:3-oxoacyl-[acyl-carrier-protein] synthase-3
MPPPTADLAEHILRRLREVQNTLGIDPPAGDVTTPFAEALDSMGMVELIAVLAEDCGVGVAEIEEACGRHFGTVTGLAEALHAAGLEPRDGPTDSRQEAPERDFPDPLESTTCWLAWVSCRLPTTRQDSRTLDALLGRPAGWLERHAGITGRWVWEDEEEALTAGADAARECLARVGLSPHEVGALLITSEAPPLLAGLGMALHHRLGLPPQAVVLEVGGACVGFLAAMWLARRLTPELHHLLIVSIESPSHLLAVTPGSAGEAAVLFGDGAAACLLTAEPKGPGARPVLDVTLGGDGGVGHLFRVHREEGGAALAMDGPTLAGRAVKALARCVQEAAGRGGLAVEDLGAVVIHGGNGRMPGLVARRLGLAEERVWSETARVANLGSASVPVAWMARHALPDRPAVWMAVGAGLAWGSVLLGREKRGRDSFSPP